jgi:hypothetical protein
MKLAWLIIPIVLPTPSRSLHLRQVRSKKGFLQPPLLLRILACRLLLLPLLLCLTARPILGGCQAHALRLCAAQEGSA